MAIRLIRYFLRLFNIDKKRKFIFYKIVEALPNTTYRIQCINKKHTFDKSLPDIVNSSDILKHLHPAQACFLGKAYADYIKNEQIVSHPNLNLESRYGACRLKYQKRDGVICYTDDRTRQEIKVLPHVITTSKSVLDEFDAIEAFFLGFAAAQSEKTTSNQSNVVFFPKKKLSSLKRKEDVAQH